MPAPVWNWAPTGRNGYEPGFDRRIPDYQQGWTPAPIQVPVTEPGGGTYRRPGMHGMGDMFSYPQGASPQDFMQQQYDTGAMPAPEIHGDFMEESALYNQGAAPMSVHEGSMPWETGPAPWEQHAMGPPTQALDPGNAHAAVVAANVKQAQASDRKVQEAVQAAKVAADNAVRAATAGAPRVAATNAATAQAAANVAAGMAQTSHAQQAASMAQTEATKAVAAANVAAKNSMNGMNDWFELSGMGQTSFLDKRVGGVSVKHLLLGLGVAAVGYYGYRYYKKG